MVNSTEYRELVKANYQVSDDELDACIRIVNDYTGLGRVSLIDLLNGIRYDKFNPLLDRFDIAAAVEEKLENG